MNQYYILDANYHLNIMDSYERVIQKGSAEREKESSTTLLSPSPESTTLENDTIDEEDYTFNFDENDTNDSSEETYHSYLSEKAERRKEKEKERQEGLREYARKNPNQNHVMTLDKIKASLRRPLT